MTMTRDEFMSSLIDLGFEVHIPRTSSWRYALIATTGSHTLYFLIGSRSVDFKYFDVARDTLNDERGRLFTNGGVLVRNYYHASPILIHNHSLRIAEQFLAGNKLGKQELAGHGISWKDRQNLQQQCG